MRPYCEPPLERFLGGTNFYGTIMLAAPDKSLALTRRAFIGGSAALLAAPSAMARTLPGPGESLTDHAAELPQLHALVLNRAGETVYAEAFRGPGLARAANIKSVSKTVHALLAGIAIDRRILDGPDQLVLPLLGRAPFGDGRDSLTIGHLLSMQAGLASTSGRNYGPWIASADWVAHALGRDLVDRPGGRFIYSTGSWHILGAALSRASGMSLLEMARRWLGEPLGIDIPAWVRDPQGRYLGGNEMALRPRALARLGSMILNNGRHGDRQVVSPDWIAASWRPRARSPWSGDAYGYGWFLTRFAGRDAAYGRGYGGQLLVVVPALDMSIAITSDPARPALSGGYFSQLRALVERSIAHIETT